MVKITGFADEISPDPTIQIATLQAENIKYIEFRAAWGLNVLALSREQLRTYHKMLSDGGIRVSAIGSPVGKVKITDPFKAEMDRFKYSLEVAELMSAEYVRVFSYYPPTGGQITDYRDEVMRRMLEKVQAAAGTPFKIFSENESELYGMTAERCLEIVEYCGGKEQLVQCFDPANFVFNNIDPWAAWQVLSGVTGYFHIKDVTKPPALAFMPAGQGDGRIPEILEDAIVRRGYAGFLSLEPHLSHGGQMAGFSGPNMYRTAAQALKGVLDKIGAKYE